MLSLRQSGMPQPEQPKPKRKLDTRQVSVDEQIATAIEANNAFWHDVMTGVVATVQHRFNDKDLETAVEIERRVNERIAQIEQRQQLKAHAHHANGHA